MASLRCCDAERLGASSRLSLCPLMVEMGGESCQAARSIGHSRSVERDGFLWARTTCVILLGRHHLAGQY